MTRDEERKLVACSRVQEEAMRLAFHIRVTDDEGVTDSSHDRASRDD